MAITKKELSDFIRDVKLGGDPTLEGKLHPTMIWKAADIIIGNAIEQAMFKTDDSNGYQIDGDFLSTYTAPVLEDITRGEMYSIIPAPIISLKQNRGMHRVSEVKNKTNAFAQISNGANDVFSILDVHYVTTKTRFYLEGNRMYYIELRPTVKTVLIKMVAGISALDPDDEIPIPAIMEKDFIQSVMDMLMEEKITPQDKNNDNNPNIPR